MLRRLATWIKERWERKKAERGRQKLLRRAREFLAGADDAKDSGDWAGALERYQEVFHTLGEYSRDSQLWGRAASGTVDLIGRVAAYARQNNSPDAAENDCSGAFEMLAERLDSKRPAHQDMWSEAVARYVEMYVHLAEKAAESDDRGTEISHYKSALERQPATKRLAELKVRVAGQLANRYLHWGDQALNGGDRDVALKHYDDARETLEPFDQKPPPWNEILGRMADCHLQEAEEHGEQLAFERAIASCRTALDRLRQKTAPGESDQELRARAVDGLAKPFCRWADDARNEGNRLAAAKHYLDLLEILHSYEAHDGPWKPATDAIPRLVRLSSWEHAKRFLDLVLEANPGGRSELYERWLQDFRAVVKQLKEAPGSSVDVEVAENLIDACEALGCAAVKTTGYERLDLRLAVEAEPAEVVTLAKKLVEKPTLGDLKGLNRAERILTLQLWGRTLEHLVQHAPDFLTGPRVLALVELIETLSEEPELNGSRLNALKQVLYHRILTREQYDHSDYEGLYPKKRRHLDYLYCLEAATEIAQEAGSEGDRGVWVSQRVDQLCRIAERGFKQSKVDEQDKFDRQWRALIETLSSREGKLSSKEGKFRVKEDKRRCLPLGRESENSKTESNTNRELAAFYAKNAEELLTEKHFQEAVANYTRAIKWIKVLFGNLSSKSWGQWEEERRRCYDRIVDALCRQAVSLGVADRPGANRSLAEALTFLRQRQELSPRDQHAALERRRQEILRGMSVEHLGGVELSGEDFKCCRQWAQEFAEKQPSDVVQTGHFLALAQHGGAVDQVEVDFYYGLACRHAERWKEAEEHFLRVVESAAVVGGDA